MFRPGRKNSARRRGVKAHEEIHSGWIVDRRAIEFAEPELGSFDECERRGMSVSRGEQYQFHLSRALSQRFERDDHTVVEDLLSCVVHIDYTGSDGEGSGFPLQCVKPDPEPPAVHRFRVSFQTKSGGNRHCFDGLRPAEGCHRSL